MNLQHIPRKKVVLFVGDAIAVTFAAMLANNVDSLVLMSNQSWTEMGVVLLAYLACFYLADLYQLETRVLHSKYLYRFLGAVASGGSGVMVLSYLVLRIEVGFQTIVLKTISVLFSTLMWRIFFDLLFKRFFVRKTVVVVVGTGTRARAVYDSIKHNAGIEFEGFVDEGTARVPDGKDNPRILGGIESLDQIPRNGRACQIVLATTSQAKSSELLKRILNCKMKGAEVLDAPAFCEQLHSRIEIEHVTDHWLVSIPILGVKSTIYNRKIKRLVGIVLSSCLLLVSLPLIIITSSAIKLDSQGPVFYRQRRVGVNGNSFWLIKFRSMTIDAETNGAVWASKEDPRVTRVGKVIRKIRIDEIPQMWNVLRGDMNFFGPRPERPEFVELLKKEISYYDMRHLVKPGITGWAQVNYPYGASVNDALQKLKYDLFYIKNLSLFLDFHILLRTVRTVLFGIGAR